MGLRDTSEGDLAGCPSHDSLRAVARGAGTDGDRTHVEGCTGCLAALAELVGDEDPTPLFAGRYELYERLGEGTFGRVYRGWDSLLERDIAIKRYRDPSLRGALVEARALAKLRHMHVVMVFDVGEAEGESYVAMELVSGVALHEREGDGRGARTTTRLLLEAAQGLEAAHRHGVIHRDLKPHNIVIDRGGRAVVVDFGLARNARRAGEGDAEGSTGVAGSPAYMAPERLRGQEASAASDVFAFCVTAVEAYTGARPYDSASASGLVAAIERFHAEGAPMPPPIPRRLRAVLRRGLGDDPCERPAMAEIIGALRPRGRAGGVVAGGVFAAAAGLGAWWVAEPDARCTGAQAQIAERWNAGRRADVHRALTGIEAAYAKQVGERTVAALDEYAAQWAATHTEACEATSIRAEQSVEVMDARMACLHRAGTELGAVVGVLATADAEVVAKAHDVVAGLTPLSDCDETLALRTGTPAPQPREADEVEAIGEQLAQARAELAAGRASVALATLDKLAPRVQAVEYGPVKTEEALARGAVFEMLSDYEAAERSLLRALELASESRQWDALHSAALKLMLVVGERQARPAEGLRYRELASGSRDQGEYFATLSALLSGQGAYEEAEHAARQAVAIEQAASGPGTVAVASARSAWVIALEAQGEYADAEQESREALADAEQELGAAHPKMAALHNLLGKVLGAAGNYAGAAMHTERALSIDLRVYGPENLSVAESRANGAVVLYHRGEYARAEAEYRAALAVMERSLGPAHPNVWIVLRNLAAAMRDRGDLRGSEAVLRDLLDRQQRAPEGEPLEVAMTRLNLGACVRDSGRHEEAELEFRRAVTELQTAGGSDHPLVVMAQGRLSEVLLKRGRADEARAMAEQALRPRAIEVPPDIRAGAASALAKSLWASRSSTQDRARARALMAGAIEDLAKSGEVYAADIETCRTWLDTHPLPGKQ